MPKTLQLCRRFAPHSVAAFGCRLLVTAAVADTVSRLPPVARSRYALRRGAVQGAGGGGGQKEGGGGGGKKKKASLIYCCDESAECICCYCCVEWGPIAVAAVSPFPDSFRNFNSRLAQ